MSAPILRVVGGSPTAEELAVVAALLTATTAGGESPVTRVAARRGGWNDPARQHQPPLHNGPNGWRAAALAR